MAWRGWDISFRAAAQQAALLRGPRKRTIELRFKSGLTEE
jgi:hypothetical protein